MDFLDYTLLNRQAVGWISGVENEWRIETPMEICKLSGHS
jgi:hypothetical protein